MGCGGAWKYHRTMLPIQEYEGLATGIYKAFEKANIPFNMAYMRAGRSGWKVWNT